MLFSHPVVCNSLLPHGWQLASPPCPSPSPGVCPSSCSLHQWYYISNILCAKKLKLAKYFSFWNLSSTWFYFRRNLVFLLIAVGLSAEISCCFAQFIVGTCGFSNLKIETGVWLSYRCNSVISCGIVKWLSSPTFLLYFILWMILKFFKLVQLLAVCLVFHLNLLTIYCFL